MQLPLGEQGSPQPRSAGISRQDLHGRSRSMRVRYGVTWFFARLGNRSFSPA